MRVELLSKDTNILHKIMNASSRLQEKASQGPAADSQSQPFWKTTPLEAMSGEQWESLCDGCGRCCLVKLEDFDTGEILFTDVGCSLLVEGTCRCADYPHRQEKVEDCVRLTPEAVRTLTWLPVTCAYRLVAEGKDLADWHPLISGSSETVHEAGISVRGRLSGLETEMSVDEQIDRIARWPNEWPGIRRKRPKR